MTAAQLVKKAQRLVSMPAIAMRIYDMVDDPHHSAQDIGKVISRDPALTARLLRIANSPFYGLPSEIETVSRAITILGTKQIRDLILATSVIKTFTGITNKLVTMENFWYHSMACGIAARHLAMKTRPERAESIFIAGLLHDIGQLILFNCMPEETGQALMLVEEGAELQDAERRIIGFDHARVGGELIASWNLPDSLRECVEYHHDIDAAGECRYEVAMVHVASVIAIMDDLSTVDRPTAPVVDRRAWEMIGLDESVFEPTLATVREQTEQTYRLFAT